MQATSSLEAAGYGKSVGDLGNAENAVGVRVIYYWAVRQEQIVMLLRYPKSERDDLTKDQLKILRRIIEEEYP
jgi:hypothetical protein